MEYTSLKDIENICENDINCIEDNTKEKINDLIKNQKLLFDMTDCQFKNYSKLIKINIGIIILVAIILCVFIVILVLYSYFL